MHEANASRTAYRVAIRRAEHQILDQPLILRDPVAMRILEPDARAKIRHGVVTRTQRLTLSFRAFMVVRSRFAEDELAKAVASGIRQYVILGAGLDTFAYRNPHPDLQVFEVDHPATQAWKHERLAAGNIHIPASTSFVPADFERHSLAEELAASSFDPHAPAFFSWLGVTPYLTDRAFAQTMEFVASMPPPSGIALDYSIPRSSLNPREQMALDALTARVAHAGEPLRLFFDPAELDARLRNLGFSYIEDLGRDEMNARYTSGRTDRLRVKGNLAHLLLARV